MFTPLHCCLDVVIITILYFHSQVAQSYVKKFGGDKVRVLTLVKNRGKGGAVRLGMLSGRGERLLFADADGATKFSEIAKLESSLQTTNTKEVSRCYCLVHAYW